MSSYLLMNLMFFVVVIGVSLGMLWIARRFRGSLSETDRIGGVVGAATAVYSVILGMIVVAAWQRFNDAEMLLGTENDALFMISRLATNYPEDDRTEIRTLLIDYADAVVKDELGDEPRWSKNASMALRQLYDVHTAMGLNPKVSPAVLQESIGAVLALEEARGQRITLINTALPWQFWLLLLFGAVVTVCFVSLFTTEQKWVHVPIVIATALVISMTLALLVDLDQPLAPPIRADVENYSHAVRALEAEIRATPAT